MSETKKKKNWLATIKKILLIVLLVLLSTVLGTFAFFMVLNRAPDQNATNERSTHFEIHRGESLSEIADRLQSGHLIRSAFLLQLYGRLMQTHDDFQLGIYAIPTGLSMIEIHDYLIGGKQVQVKITIPEGFTARQIATALEKAGICQAADFMAILQEPEFLEGTGLTKLQGTTGAEGFLYPDTYQFAAGLPARVVAGAMVQNFLAHLGKIPNVPEDPAEIRQKIILASIIEKEYVATDEAPLMASVFINRLKMGKALESCATIVYVLTEELGLPHPGRIYYRDLSRPSPYNTYQNRGLPPGPISNPGAVALEAAFNPAQTDYLYFVLKGPDAERHHFSRTFAEHSQASVFYLKKQ